MPKNKTKRTQTDDPKDPASTRKRHDACGPCRNKKTKCSGEVVEGSPCKQCAHLGEKCEFKRPVPESEYERLENRIAFLKAQIDEIKRRQPTDESSSAGSPISSGSPEAMHTSLQPRPLSTLSRSHSENVVASSSRSLFSLSASSSNPDFHSVESFFGGAPPVDPYTAHPPPSHEDYHILLESFEAHSRQIGFNVNMDWLTGKEDRRKPHLALVNAMLLVACNFEPQAATAEPGLLSSAQHHITAARHKQTDGMCDIALATCLLSYHFFLNAREKEGFYYSYLACRLSMEIGLHQISPGWQLEGTVWDAGSREVVECVSAFWSIFMVEQTWSVHYGYPSVLLDSPCVITTPWLDEQLGWLCYQIPIQNIVHTLYERPVTIPTVCSLRARAAALYGWSQIVVKALRNDPANENLEEQATRIKTATNVLRGDPFLNHDDVDGTLLIVRTLLDVTDVQIRALDGPNDDNERLVHAFAVVQSLDNVDFSSVDPFISKCWENIAQFYEDWIRVREWHNELERPGYEESYGRIMEAISKLKITRNELRLGGRAMP